MLVYSQLISLTPIHILKLRVYFLVEMVSKQIMKTYHRDNIPAKSIVKRLTRKEKNSKCHEILRLLPAILETLTDLIKIGFIIKKNTILTQTSTPVGVNIIGLSKHGPESSLVHPY